MVSGYTICRKVSPPGVANPRVPRREPGNSVGVGFNRLIPECLNKLLHCLDKMVLVVSG